jgi:hypothetical protein
MENEIQQKKKKAITNDKTKQKAIKKTKQNKKATAGTNTLVYVNVIPIFKRKTNKYK